MPVFWPYDVGVGAILVPIACPDIHKLTVVETAFELVKQGQQLGIEPEIEFSLEGFNRWCGNDSGEGCVVDSKSSITAKRCLKRFEMAANNGLPNLGSHQGAVRKEVIGQD